MRRRLLRPGHRLRRASRIAVTILLALLLAWAAGFVRFVRRASLRPSPPPHADGIVVLTGGAGRIEAALQLLANGVGKRLMVSGIGGGANLNDLARHAGIDPTPLAARVTLGRGATTTHGNAAETADWARQSDVRSLIVVTAAYHMPRALTEIGRALPRVTLYAAPVLPPGVIGADGWPTAFGLWLLLDEWNKLLAAEIGLTALEAVPAPRLAAASSSLRPER